MQEVVLPLSKFACFRILRNTLIFYFQLLILLTVIGKLVVHALDEKVRAYYNLERLWSTDASNQDHGVGQDQVKTFLFPCQFVQLNNYLSHDGVFEGFGQGVFEGSP